MYAAGSGGVEKRLSPCFYLFYCFDCLDSAKRLRVLELICLSGLVIHRIVWSPKTKSGGWGVVWFAYLDFVSACPNIPRDALRYGVRRY